MLRSWRLNVLLFVLTCASTWLVAGTAFAVSIMGILVFHEMGHYIQARRYRVPATLPYFLPMPISPFGTMGAVIRMDNVGADRKALFDIGVSGPIAGLVVAIPVTMWGLARSQVIATQDLQGVGLQLGDSLLFMGLARIVVGVVPEGSDILLHPAAFAGWAGLFITALNLLPVGQLDGGHVVYALLGRRSYWVSVAAAIGFGLIALFVSRLWTLMVILVLLMGLRHPPTADDTVALGRTRIIVGILAMVFFLLSFTPDPMKLG